MNDGRAIFKVKISIKLPVTEITKTSSVNSTRSQFRDESTSSLVTKKVIMIHEFTEQREKKNDEVRSNGGSSCLIDERMIEQRKLRIEN